MKPYKSFTGMIDRINRLFSGIAAVILVIMAIAVCLSSITRLFHLPFEGILDFSEFGLLWITFLSTAWLLSRDGHIRIDVVRSRLRPKAGIILDIATYVINMLIFAVIVWYSAKTTYQHFQNNFILKQTVFGIPKAPVEIIIPIGCFLIIADLFRKLRMRLSDWRSLRRPS